MCWMTILALLFFYNFFICKCNVVEISNLKAYIKHLNEIYMQSDLMQLEV